MHPGATQYHLVQPPAHMQSTTQVIPSQQIDTNALHFSTLMPQLSASMRQLQLSSHPVSLLRNTQQSPQHYGHLSEQSSFIVSPKNSNQSIQWSHGT